MSYAHRAKQKAARRTRRAVANTDRPLSEHELARLKYLAGLIRDDAQLEAILADVDPLYRESVRTVLVEHLTFTPQALAN